APAEQDPLPQHQARRRPRQHPGLGAVADRSAARRADRVRCSHGSAVHPLYDAVALRDHLRGGRHRLRRRDLVGDACPTCPRMTTMRRTGLLVVVALAIASGNVRTEGPTPVIVELFTSEGCSDCPPADTLLDRLIATQPVAGAEIIGLGQHVDYWDRLGWKDRFSSAALTNRQRQYQARFNTESIYTPQMVVDGRAEFVGSDAG